MWYSEEVVYMKKIFFPLWIALIFLSACGNVEYICSDPLGCVEVASGESIQIGGLLTMSGTAAPYGIDASRGVELALTDKDNIKGFPLQLVLQDDLCSEEGGANGAAVLASNNKIAGVVGATCSSASISAARVLTEAKMVLISPSSTTPSLTETGTHETGFLRVIYNDKIQGRFVAEFTWEVLGMSTMITVHDGSPYSKQLQQAACENFDNLGGKCTQVFEIKPNTKSMESLVKKIALLKPDILYYPIYTADGIALTNEIRKQQLTNIALISSDGLFSTEFIKETNPISQGMYISGPANVDESPELVEKYTTRFGEAPIASYHAQGYDAAMMLMNAIEQVATESNGTLYIPRQALRAALYQTQNMQGESGLINCVPSGDCATPKIIIYQIQSGNFTPIYP